jgi:hydrogenase maturation protease HycI
MSSPSWQNSLNQTLRSLSRPDQPTRIALVGIGHELRGDDSAGIAIARALQPSANDHLLIIDAGPAPENHTGALRRFKPDLILLIDAAQMDDPPGTIRCLDWRATTGISASTHTFPLHLFARYLTEELGCSIALIGIQPAQTLIGLPLSPVMQAAVDTVVGALRDSLT